GGGPEDNAQRIIVILQGREQGPARDAVALNAGAALVAAGVAATLAEGVERALEAIASGAALRKLEELRRYSRGRAACFSSASWTQNGKRWPAAGKSCRWAPSRPQLRPRRRPGASARHWRQGARSASSPR